MFRGQYFHAMDEKGRVAIPARFREVLAGLGDERLVLAPYEDRQSVGLEAFPFAAWRKLEDNLQGNHPYDERTLDLIYARVALAVDCLPDAQGRILVPPDLREDAGLKREIAFQGHIATFRIWDAEVWRTVRSGARQVFRDVRLTTVKV